MASAETGAAVEVQTRIAASPETIFDFFTDPDKLILWMGRSAELDARPGGVFRCDINGEAVASGEYLEVDPPNRVVFSWGWEGEDAVTPAPIPGLTQTPNRRTEHEQPDDVVRGGG